MIPYDEWLSEAKRLHVGQKKRIRHGCGRTASLDVYNNVDGWSCWCFRCHDGGRMPKQHQQLNVVRVDPDRVQPVPADVIHITQASRYEQQRIWELLVQKGCPPGIIPEEALWFSASANRILLRQGNQALGRALSPRQLPKWLEFGKWFGQPKAWWTRYRDAGPMVLVEDALSSYKVAKAIEHYAPESALSVLATLGTTVVPGLIPVLAGRDIICMYDGDRAGADGAAGVRRRMAVFGGKFIEARPTSGDPKDMTLESLYERIKTNLPRSTAGT